MPTKGFSLTREFVGEIIETRTFALQIAALAVTLAQAAGEPVKRPLSKAQIERAIDVNASESRMIIDRLIERLEALYREGDLPVEAGVPRW